MAEVLVEGEGWERLAAPRGGTVPGLWADPASSVVLAATWAGVHRSTDGGATWQPAASGPSVPFAEAVVALARGDAQRDAGSVLGSTCLAAAADGLYRSTDAGLSWQRILTGGRCLSLAACGDVVLAGTESDGVLRSEDGGRTWSGANTGLRDTAVLSLALSPIFDADGLGFAGTASGLYRTRSGGRAWREVDLGLPGEPAVECVAVGVGPDDARLVLVGTAGHGLLGSPDGGSHWARVAGLAVDSVSAVATHPSGHIAVATELGVAVSDDHGQSWHLTGGNLGPVLSLAWSLTGALLAGLLRDGVARSTDGGVHWSLEAPGLAASVILGLVVVPRPSGEVRLLSIGLQRGLEASDDGGRTWTQQATGLDDEATLVGLAAGADGSVCLATSSGVVRSADAGHTWQRIPAAGLPITAIAAARARAWVVAGSASGAVLRSDDYGQTWRALEALPGREAGEITAIEVAGDGTALVATRTRRGRAAVWRLARSAGRWERILDEPTDSTPRLAVMGDGGEDELLVGLGRRLLQPVRHAYERRDGERRPVWRATTLDPPDALITNLVAPPGGSRTVLVGTSAGVYVSRDGGATLTTWSDGLQPRAIVALAVGRDQRVYGASLGGARWRRRALT